MIDSVVFWGATGQAKVLRELLEPQGPKLVAIFDNNLAVESPWQDIPLHHGWAGFEAWKARQGDLTRIGCLVAIGGVRGSDRIRVQRSLAAAGLTPLVARHPSAFVAGSARLGKGSQILAQAFVGVEVRLGEACIINTAATVDHECNLGDGVHVAPGAHITGLVEIGDDVLVGAGAVILPRVVIGAGAIVGAGAVVTRNVAAGDVIVGNPARSHRRKEST